MQVRSLGHFTHKGLYSQCCLYSDALHHFMQIDGETTPGGRMEEEGLGGVKSRPRALLWLEHDVIHFSRQSR